MEVERSQLNYEAAFDIHAKEIRVTAQPLPSQVSLQGEPPTVLVTSGASCPDASVERVVRLVLDHYGGRDVDSVLTEFEQSHS